MVIPVALLLAAVAFLVVSLGPGHAVLAWASVGLSAVAAALILRRWRRSRQRGHEPLDDASALTGGKFAADAEVNDTGSSGSGEEDTDAADVLVVYELADEVLVVDEHPRYHLTRCRFPDRDRAERLPVKEARELGFTPCERCKPDKALARKHRAGQATLAGGTAKPGVKS